MWEKLPHEQQLIVLGLIVSIAVGLAITAFRFYSPAAPEKITLETPPTAVTVMVHISGAVKKEGVYRFKTGDRVIDALNLAGGALPPADLSSINLAEVLKDGEKIIIPEKQKPEETVDEPIKNGKGKKRLASANAGKIKINTADVKALDTLPGVGPATAQAIIEYRKANGPFTKIDQLMKIPRFGKSRFAKVKELVTL
ncbi:MAG: helix-hairpin-helix domain-containing protein [Candidatus Margulisiibacteriota bacterium]